MFKPLLVILLVLISFGLNAQEGITTFGIQYKPIIPNRIIGTFEQEFNEGALESSIKQTLGHSYGMLIRHGFTEMISMEMGINYNFRKFNLNWAVPDSGFSATNKVRVVSYELPVMGLVFIRLGEDLWMNTSLGSSLTLFSTDVRVVEPIRSDEYFSQEGAYKSKIQGAFLANLGFEYRTRKIGYFYIGASYHLPFTPIMDFAMSYEHPPGEDLSIQSVRGSYLTLDFKYFFNENRDD